MLALDHVVFPVRDAQATLEFYSKVLELPLLRAMSGEDWGGYPWLMMVFGAGDQELVTVALRGSPSPDYRGLPGDARHYAFACSDKESEGWRERLRRAGVDFWEEDHGGQQSLYFPDPDGVILEITWPRSTVAATASSEAFDAARRWIAASLTA